MIEEIYEELKGFHPVIDDQINAMVSDAIWNADKWLHEMESEDDELLEDDIDKNIDNYFEQQYTSESDMEFINTYRAEIVKRLVKGLID